MGALLQEEGRLFFFFHKLRFPLFTNGIHKGMSVLNLGEFS